MTAARRQLAAARRVVVKVGLVLADQPDRRPRPARLDALVDALAARRAAGSQVVLVSSGAIAAGLAPLRLTRRPRDLATQQAAAGGRPAAARRRPTRRRSPGTGSAIGQVLLTADDMIRRAHYRNAQRTLERLLGLGVLPVVNENDTVATDEIRVGDNDRLAALVAHLSAPTGWCCSPTSTGSTTATRARPGARLLTDVDAPADLDAVRVASAGADSLGTGGMATKITAAAMASASGIPVLLAAAEDVARGAGHVRDGPEGGHRVPAVRAADVGAPVLAAARRRRPRPPGAGRGRGGRGAGAAAVAAGRRASAGSPATSWPVTWSTWSGRTAPWWPAGWSASTPPSCPR